MDLRRAGGNVGVESVRGAATSERAGAGQSLNNFLLQRADKALGRRQTPAPVVDTTAPSTPASVPTASSTEPVTSAPAPYQMAQLAKLQRAMGAPVNTGGITMVL